MRILLLTAYFPPDTGSAAHLFYELGTALAKRGHDIWVVTSKPSYHVTEDVRKYSRKLWLREKIKGLHVVRVALPTLPRNMPLARGIWQMSAGAFFSPASLLIPKPDVALVYSPPVFLGFSSWILRSFKHVPFIFNVQDLFPQSVIDLGLLSNKLLIRFFEGIERFMYKRADMITVHSSGNSEHVVEKGALREKVHIMSNWVDTGLLKPGPRDNELRIELNLQKKFIVSFAGVLGYSQDLDIVLEAARLLLSTPDIVFLIVGDGVEKKRLQLKAESMRLENVTFLPMQPREKYLLLIQASDVSLATLRARVKTPVVPSKILSIMAVGIPVIAAMDMSGDAPKLIEQAECGQCVPAEQPDLLAKAIRRLYDNSQKRIEMGMKARRYAEEHLSLTKAAERYEELMRSLIGKEV